MEINSIHVLIVDDHDAALQKRKTALAHLGYLVTTDHSPLSALEWLEGTRQKPNLILVSADLAHISSSEFVRKVRAIKGYTYTMILMLSDQPEAGGQIETQAGADRYLSRSVSPIELDQAIRSMLTQSGDSSAAPVVAARSPNASKTITVFSLKGGVGTTMLSVNLSVLLSQMWGSGAHLWDMALSGGQCALFLNMKGKKTPAALDQVNPLSVDDRMLEQMLLKHESGVKLMPAPASVAENELITERTAGIVWPYLQSQDSFLVIDGGNHFTDPMLCLLERSDIILFVLSPELASVISASDALKILQGVGIDSQKIQLVLNRTFPNYTLPVNKITPLLGNRVPFELPYDSDTVVQSVHAGKPLALTSPKSELALAIARMAYQLTAKEMLAKKPNHTSPWLERIRGKA